MILLNGLVRQLYNVCEWPPSPMLMRLPSPILAIQTGTKDEFENDFEKLVGAVWR